MQLFILFSLSALTALSAPTSSTRPTRRDALVALGDLFDATRSRRLAPTLNFSAALAAQSAGHVRGGSYTPTVLMHGLGDAGSNAGMQSLAQSVMSAYNGSYAAAVNVANGLLSFLIPIADQIDEFAAAIKDDTKLWGQSLINLVGLSQGGLIVRGYVERYAGRGGYPAVKNLVSICGVQNGEAGCLQLHLMRYTYVTSRIDKCRSRLRNCIICRRVQLPARATTRPLPLRHIRERPVPFLIQRQHPSQLF